MVHPHDFEEAQKYLQQYDEVYRNALTCPKCGSHDVQYIARPGIKNWLTAIISWLFSNYAIASDHVYHCYECHHEFTDLPEQAELQQTA